MADHLPLGLLEACVVIGASSERLKEACEQQEQEKEKEKEKEFPLLDAEVLQVHAPPFVSRESSGGSPGRGSLCRMQRRRSFIKKKRERPPPAAESTTQSPGGPSEEVSVPVDIDLIALPQLCFPGGLQITSVLGKESFHFLVFTDVIGNRTYGVVVQYYRPVQLSRDGERTQNGFLWMSSKAPRLYAACAICLISKYPYYNALKDCLSCFMSQVKISRTADLKEQVKEFAAKLALVPIPPPGQLHVVFNLRPLQIVLPSREDNDYPAIDLDLHLPFLCFQPKQLLQIISSLLEEQRVVFFSSDWARLTLMAECFTLFIHPLLWQHPFVPILSRQMLDFIMAPTAFLMGCHLHHFQEVSEETDGLILINIDNGSVTTSCCETSIIADVPLEAGECFIKRTEALQIHYDLDVCHLGASTDINELRTRRREWQHRLNTQVQKITLELIVNIFREVHNHLNYEHRVFNSEEFLKSRELRDQPFYKKVLDTHIFHCFLKDRLNRKTDAFARLELSTRSEAQRVKVDSPRRPTMQEMARKHTSPECRLSKKLGMSLPNLEEEHWLRFPVRQASLKKASLQTALKISQKPIDTFKLPEFPPPLAYHYVQNYYSEMIGLLSKAISGVPSEDSALLARYYYLRGLLNVAAGKRLDALSDFQCLYRTDTDIFPGDLVRALADSLRGDEREVADRRAELKRLISRVQKDPGGDRLGSDDRVKKFELPRKHMQLEDFVKRVQESGMVKDLGTVHRLFQALTVGQQKQVDPETFQVFYTYWKETEAEAQDVYLPASVIEQLDTNECVYKLSCSVKTSHGVGKIAMTQKRLFLLTEGRPGFVQITKFRDVEEVKISSAHFLLLRIPSLRIKSSTRKDVFEANLKSECDLWNLMIKEMWAGRKMADDHKDPQYMQQALTNVLLMDAVVGCLQSQKAIFAATKLAFFDKMRLEVPMMVPKTTSETLKHKINPSLDLTAPQAVDVLLYTPGQLDFSDAHGGGNPKLWCALSGGKVVVFDATSWSMQHNGIQLGACRLNCMLGLDQNQVWVGSQDSVIYIINTQSMSCNRQLTEHRHEVTHFAQEETRDKCSNQAQAYSCSADGTVMVWDVSTLQVKKQIRLTCGQLRSIQLVSGTLWCCAKDCIMELRKNGAVHRRISLPDGLGSVPTGFCGFMVLPERNQLWTGCEDASELCVWHSGDMEKPFHTIQLPDCSGVNCLIRVKNQIWVGCRGQSPGKAKGKIYVVDTEHHSVEKELVAHTDAVQTLCSAEDRYVFSGSACQEGKIAIWKVE